jgi:hypothetical protein
MAQTPDDRAAALHLALARQASRDSWIFIVLGLVALGAALALGKYPYTRLALTNIGLGRVVCFGAALSACAVLLGVGAWKAVRRRWGDARGAAGFGGIAIAQTPDPCAASHRLALARQASRDSWIFIVAGLTALGVAMVFSEYPYTWPASARFGHEGTVCLGVALSACAVFLTVGCCKALRGRREGSRGLASYLAATTAWLIILGLLTFLTGIPHFRDGHWYWSLRATILILALGFIFGWAVGRWRSREPI